MTRPPIVTDIDRKWALDQCPTWATIGGGEAADEPAGEIVDETDFERATRLKAKREAPAVFRWDWFVDDQIASFERFFRAELKSPDEWSKLWRKGWWPKADPRKRLPKTMAKIVPSEPHPFAKIGTSAFALGMRLATEGERRVFRRIGVVQFKPDDPRAAQLKAAIGGAQ